MLALLAAVLAFVTIGSVGWVLVGGDDSSAQAVKRVTGYDTHIPLFRLEMKYLPSVDKVVAAAKRTLASG